MTVKQIVHIYEEIKAGVDVFQTNPLIVSNPVIIHYYIIKAHKIVCMEHYHDYWNDGRSKDPIRAVLSSLYSYDEDALQYCHSSANGLPALAKYIEAAESVFTHQYNTSP